MMRMQGDHITEEDIDAFIKQTDQNGDGYINYEGKVTILQLVGWALKTVWSVICLRLPGLGFQPV